jgi:hypothetical protein
MITIKKIMLCAALANAFNQVQAADQFINPTSTAWARTRPAAQAFTAASTTSTWST